MNAIRDEKEAAIRFKVRWNWSKEGHLETHKQYPNPSIGRLIALDEEQKIRFEDLTYGN